MVEFIAAWLALALPLHQSAMQQYKDALIRSGLYYKMDCIYVDGIYLKGAEFGCKPPNESRL